MSDCALTETVCHGIKVVYIENKLLLVSILVGKGADLYEMIDKEQQVDFLLKSSKGLEVFKDKDLAKDRLKMYSEPFAGGWQDCLPHRGRYKDVEITQETGGIAATLPWDYEVLEHSTETLAIRCYVQLPLVPLFVEKIFRINSNESKLYIEERICNKGDAPAQFTWTQHAAFGGNFLDEHVSIELPECIVFHPRNYDPVYEQDLGRFEEPVHRVTNAHGRIRDIREVSSRKDREQFFIVLKDLSKPLVTLFHSRKQIGFSLCWDLAAFPFIRYWSNNTDQLYTVGIEPSNDAFVSFDHSLAHSTYRELKPLEAYHTQMTCEIFKRNK